jgi:SAM-dependent methyltransferase
MSDGERSSGRLRSWVLHQRERSSFHASMAVRRLAVRDIPRSESSPLASEFRALCRRFDAPSVLELGTRQSTPGRSTMHRDWVPHAAEFLGTDLQHGADVDVIADAHTLSSTFGRERFDAIISCSTFEHIKYPVLAAHELMKTLKVGGVLFVQTHQAFALHGYPRDYCRFSREALAALFPAAMGFRVITTDYEFPARIYSRRAVDQHLHAAWLNSLLLGVEEARTPREFSYELEKLDAAI